MTIIDEDLGVSGAGTQERRGFGPVFFGDHDAAEKRLQPKNHFQEHFQGNEAWETTEAGNCHCIINGSKSQKGTTKMMNGRGKGAMSDRDMMSKAAPKRAGKGATTDREMKMMKAEKRPMRKGSRG